MLLLAAAAGVVTAVAVGPPEAPDQEGAGDLDAGAWWTRERLQASGHTTEAGQASQVGLRSCYPPHSTAAHMWTHLCPSTLSTHPWAWSCPPARAPGESPGTARWGTAACGKKGKITTPGTTYTSSLDTKQCMGATGPPAAAVAAPPTRDAAMQPCTPPAACAALTCCTPAAPCWRDAARAAGGVVSAPPAGCRPGTAPAAGHCGPRRIKGTQRARRYCFFVNEGVNKRSGVRWVRGDGTHAG